MLKGHTGGARAVAFTPDGETLASAGQDRTFKLWDPVTGQERGTLRGTRETSWPWYSRWTATGSFPPAWTAQASSGIALSENKVLVPA